MAYVLWKETMKLNPKNPFFFNRDRFVLSAGHGEGILMIGELRGFWWDWRGCLD